MMTKTMRLGRDAEVKSGNNGEFVSLSLAYNVGFGDNKRTVWVSAIWFGKQAISACQYLTKGSQVTVSLKDIEPHVYNEKASLKGVVVELDFVGAKQESTPAPAPKPKAKPEPADDLDDDIPFN
jgi:single-strand DNA-binding protein